MKTSTKSELRAARHRRIRAKVSGTAERPRLVVSRSSKHNYAQLVDDTKGMVLVGMSDSTVAAGKVKQGTKTEKAKLLGSAIGKAAIEKNISACVFDRSGHKYHGRVKAVADGAREAGLKF
ncbi:MAG: 50S ribosomal protein L18 [Patescibacteria group bacterium]